jgi:hypothetical protein
MKKWFKRVRHLPFLPDHLRLNFSNDLLRTQPYITSPIVHAQWLQFCSYFRDYWVNTNFIRDVWGQFGNSGPRTTNMVEGWHNGLHSRFNGRHPSIAELVDFFKTSQHSSQYRIQALVIDPMAMALPMSAEIIRRHHHLQTEMTMFSQYFSTNFVSFDSVMIYLDRIIAIGLLPQTLRTLRTNVL